MTLSETSLFQPTVAADIVLVCHVINESERIEGTDFFSSLDRSVLESIGNACILVGDLKTGVAKHVMLTSGVRKHHGVEYF